MNMFPPCLRILATLIIGLHLSLASAQNIDSLKAVWHDASRHDTVRLMAFQNVIWGGYLFSAPDSALILADSMRAYALSKGLKLNAADAMMIRGIHFMIAGDFDGALKELAIAKGYYEEAGSADGVAGAQNNMGNAYWKKGDLSHAIEMYTAALQASERMGKRNGVATAELNIGLIYTDLGDDVRATEHYKKALKIFTEMGLPDGIGEASLNLAHRTMVLGDTTLALEQLGEALDAFVRGGNVMYQGTTLMSQAKMLTGRKQWEQALRCIEKGDSLAAELGDEFGIRVQLARSEYHYARREYDKALVAAEAGSVLADKYGTLSDRKDMALLMYQSNKELGRPAEALKYQDRFVELGDSLRSEENQRGLLRQEYKYTYDKQALSDSLTYAADKAIQVKEIQKQKVMRNGFMLGFALVIAFAGVFFFQRNRIAREKERSEELLLNILPEEVAEELKAKGEAEARLINEVTVLFTDFKGFTAMSEMLSPKDLVRDLNECFSAFDHIMEKHGIEKIKTIGDAYMAAGGLPTPNATHALDVVKAAFEMRDFIAAGKADKIARSLPYFEIRIGIHTGPVVAGIVGVKKFAYDIWGDTVNTASRMESSGEVGQVNISESTYAVVKGEAGLVFDPRGKVQAKGKGELEMYFVRRSTEGV